MGASEVWDEFVARGCVDSEALAGGIRDLMCETLHRDSIPEMAYISFSLASQSLLLGAEKLGHLATAIERCFALLYDGQLDPSSALPLLASGIETMSKAFSELLAADKSGARIENTPLNAAIYELETLYPLPETGGEEGAAIPRPASKSGPDVLLSRLSKSAPKATPPSIEAAAVGGQGEFPADTKSSTTTLPVLHSPETAMSDTTWNPTVDNDILDLFFEEVNERIETLSIKLLEVEQRPQDTELLQDVFRDWHTIKGSSAMVELPVMTKLAHAAEDLVGQLREGERVATTPVVDALLAALDLLRSITATAQQGKAFAGPIQPLLARLRAPEAHQPSEPVPPSTLPTPDTSPRTVGKATIRVDFDKLDGLMNLVGELVLGRDGLGSAISALSSLSGELSGRQKLSHLLSKVGVLLSTNSSGNSTLQLLREELGRVERVLVDISQDLETSSGRLDTISNDLRDTVMSLRMVPVGGIFRKHLRTVRDISKSQDKDVQLTLVGEDVELDKLLVEALDDPLMHLVRNAVDHGIESKRTRSATGKTPRATIELSAQHVGNQVVLTIRDDGKGIDVDVIKAKALEKEILSANALESISDKEALELIFHPGFSTSASVSEVSGRGVGMDVVRQTVVHELKGSIDIDTRLGECSTFTLRMPLTLAIADVLLARTGGETLAIPLDAVARSLVVPSSAVQRIVDKDVLLENGQQIPLIWLGPLLGLESVPQHSANDAGLASLRVVLCHHGSGLVGLVVDTLLEKKEIVIKTLGDVLEELPCIAGATLLGDRCAVILDIPAIVERAMKSPQSSPLNSSPQSDKNGESHETAARYRSDTGQKSILLVEDSETVRETLRRLLSDAGYRVVVAEDGAIGLTLAKQEAFDLVSTDVMMPNLDGYGLTRALREDDNYRDTPIVMVTSRGERIDRVRGFDAGVDEYITKPHDRHILLRTVKKLLRDS